MRFREACGLVVVIDPRCVSGSMLIGLMAVAMKALELLGFGKLRISRYRSRRASEQ